MPDEPPEFRDDAGFPTDHIEGARGMWARRPRVSASIAACLLAEEARTGRSRAGSGARRVPSGIGWLTTWRARPDDPSRGQRVALPPRGTRNPLKCNLASNRQAVGPQGARPQPQDCWGSGDDPSQDDHRVDAPRCPRILDGGRTTPHVGARVRPSGAISNRATFRPASAGTFSRCLPQPLAC